MFALIFRSQQTNFDVKIPNVDLLNKILDTFWPKNDFN